MFKVIALIASLAGPASAAVVVRPVVLSIPGAFVKVQACCATGLGPFNQIQTASGIDAPLSILQQTPYHNPLAVVENKVPRTSAMPAEISARAVPGIADLEKTSQLPSGLVEAPALGVPFQPAAGQGSVERSRETLARVIRNLKLFGAWAETPVPEDAVSPQVLPSGAEVRYLNTKGGPARLVVDRETRALLRRMPAGRSFTLTGSKALQMLAIENLIEPHGLLSPDGDVDLYLSWRNRDLKNLIREAYPGREVSFVAASVLKLDPYSLGRLSMTFTSKGSGAFSVHWARGLREATRGYADLLTRTIRHVAVGPMDVQDAAQGLLYFLRFTGASFESKTEKLIGRRLRSYDRAGLWYDLTQALYGGWPMMGRIARLEKLYKHPHSRVLVRLFARFGAFDRMLRYEATGIITSSLLPWEDDSFNAADRRKLFLKYKREGLPWFTDSRYLATSNIETVLDAHDRLAPAWIADALQ